MNIRETLKFLKEGVLKYQGKSLSRDEMKDLAASSSQRVKKFTPTGEQKRSNLHTKTPNDTKKEIKREADKKAGKNPFFKPNRKFPNYRGGKGSY